MMRQDARYWMFGFCLVVSASVSFGGVKRVDTEQLVVALTFDDGPNPPYTEQLLQTLEDKQVKATFFLIGLQVEKYPDLGKKMGVKGHEIGGHSYGWNSLTFRKRAVVEDQLDKMDAAFADAGITNLTLFRPPGGFLFPWQNSIVESRGLSHISADVVVGDWKSISAETIRDRVLKKVRPGSIIVLHDGGGNRAATIAAVPLIIDGLKARGYELVTVSELLEK